MGPYSSCNDTLASGLTTYSLPCMLDFTSNRPNIIALNFCGAYALQNYQPQRLIALVVQQMIHSLVGGPSLSAAVLLLLLSSCPQAPLEACCVLNCFSLALDRDSSLTSSASSSPRRGLYSQPRRCISSFPRTLLVQAFGATSSSSLRRLWCKRWA